MPIPLSRESPNLTIVDWCLIVSQGVPIGEYVIGITLACVKITTVLTSWDQRLTEKYRWSNLVTLVAYAVLLYSPLIATVYVVANSYSVCSCTQERDFRKVCSWF